jgi:hypothetical protein
MDPNVEVLKQINESKNVGKYLLQNYTPKDHGVFHQTIGYGSNSGGYTSSSNIDSDSFLKNLHFKNSKKIQYNPIRQDINFKPNFIKSPLANVSSKERKSCNNVVSSQNISSRYFSFIENPQSHINYDKGIDSRHQNR